MKLQRDARKGRLLCVVALAGVGDLFAATMPMQTMMSRMELAADQAPALGLVGGEADGPRTADLFAAMAGRTTAAENWVELRPHASTASVTSLLRVSHAATLGETRCAMLLPEAAANPRLLAARFNGIDSPEGLIGTP